MTKKYGALQIFSFIYRFIGVIIPLIGLAAAFLFVSQTQDFLTAGGIFLSSLISGISFFALGQLISLLIDLEFNTRRTAALLERQLKS